MFALTLLFILQLEDTFEIVSLPPNGTQTIVAHSLERQKDLGNKEEQEKYELIHVILPRCRQAHALKAQISVKIVYTQCSFN